MLISFEGMDGAGKSSVSKKVSKITGFTHSSQRIAEILNISEENFDKLVREVNHSSNNHLGLMFYTFRCMLDKNSNNDLIVERSMASTYYFEREKVSKEDFDYMMTMDVIPDITFLLYASIDTRMERIMNRNIHDKDLQNVTALQDGYDKMLECVNNYNMKYVGINTENLSVDEVSIICSDIILKYKNLKTELEKQEYLKDMNKKFGFDNLYKNKNDKKLIKK